MIHLKKIFATKKGASLYYNVEGKNQFYIKNGTFEDIINALSTDENDVMNSARIRTSASNIKYMMLIGHQLTNLENYELSD